MQKREQFENEEILSSLKFDLPSLNTCQINKRNVINPFKNEINELECLFSFITRNNNNNNNNNNNMNNNMNYYGIDCNIYKESLYGCVYRGWLLKINEQGELIQTTENYSIAIKKFCKLKMSRIQAADDPIQEFSALQYIGDNHNNVLGQIECLEDSNYYYSIMRYCGGGELFKRVMNDGPLTEDNAREIFIQLVSGLEYLQTKGIFHRDISLENILLSEDGTTPYYIDFGMCLRVSTNPTTGLPALLPPMQAKGKKSYMAPEIVSELPSNGYKADIWSLGIVLFTLLSGKFIITHASPLCPLFRFVRAKRLKDMCKQWKLGFSSEVEDLIFHMLQCKPSERYTLEQIKNHPWFLSSPSSSSSSSNSSNSQSHSQLSSNQVLCS